VKKKRDAEIVNLNEGIGNFDFGDVSAEELERRLELAITTVFPVLKGCETYCSGLSCSTNCGGFIKPPLGS